VRAGLYDLNSEFDSIDTAGLFINSSHGIGPEIAQTGENGPSIFPVTSLGVRVRHASGAGYVQFVALDAVPGERQHPDRTGFSLGSSEGALMVGELGASRGAFSKLAIGAWTYTADFEAIGETDGAGAPVRASGNRGFYAMAEARLYAAETTQVTGWLRAGQAEKRFNDFAAYVGAGVAVAGLIPQRPDDQLGLAIASVEAGGPWRAQQALAGLATTARETTLEITWRMPLRDWITLQPDVQYVIHPGANADVRDALALGLRFEIAMSWSR
jgi:porin